MRINLTVLMPEEDTWTFSKAKETLWELLESGYVEIDEMSEATE